jgi:hypothetical protein
LTHHLKGFHLALAMHLPRRKADGWKLTESEWLAYISMQVELRVMNEEVRVMSASSTPMTGVDPPQTVSLIQHLRDDIFSLHEFVEGKSPPEVQARRQAALEITRNTKNAPLGSDAVTFAQRHERGYRGSFARTLPPTVEPSLGARGCGAARAILRIRKLNSM